VGVLGNFIFLTGFGGGGDRSDSFARFLGPLDRKVSLGGG
jgi:hypothetical protein